MGLLWLFSFYQIGSGTPVRLCSFYQIGSGTVRLCSFYQTGSGTPVRLCSFFFSFVRWKLQSPQWRWQCIAGPSGTLFILPYIGTWAPVRHCSLYQIGIWAPVRLCSLYQIGIWAPVRLCLFYQIGSGTPVRLFSFYSSILCLEYLTITAVKTDVDKFRFFHCHL